MDFWSRALNFKNEIFRALLKLNSPAVLETIFTDENMNTIFGILQHQNVALDQVKHRQILKERASLAVKSKNREIQNKMNLICKINYIWDILLQSTQLSITHDFGFALEQLILNKKHELLEAIINDESYLKELLSSLQNCEQKGRGELLLLLKELFCLYATARPEDMKNFLSVFCSFGLWSLLKFLMKSPDDLMATSIALDIINLMMLKNSLVVRQFILNEDVEEEKQLLVSLLVDILVFGQDDNLFERARMLLDTLFEPKFWRHNANDIGESKFFAYFCMRSLDVLTKPLKNEKLVEAVIELLSFLLKFNASQIKRLVIGKDILELVLSFLKPEYKVLSLNAIQFCHKCVQCKLFDIKFFTEGTILAPVNTFFRHIWRRDNMLASSVKALVKLLQSQNKDSKNSGEQKRKTSGLDGSSSAKR